MSRTLTWHRRGRASRPDPDAIWRGEIADADIVMTAADRVAAANAARRRSLVEMFGQPGLLAIDDPSVRHRRRGEGARHGGSIDQGRTAGCREEIQVTVLAHPVVTAEFLDDGGLVALDRAVEVDLCSREAAGKQITWSVQVRTTPWSRRDARLRLYGSPSANVTVLTLTPVRTRRRGASRFLRVGLRSMFELCGDVERHLDT